MKRSGVNSQTGTVKRRKKIIYIDDVNYSLVSVKSRIGELYDVYTAVSAVKLFEFLDNITPDLILLDVNMPDVDGYETIKNIKKDERYSNIPVIFLTGNSDRESVVKGLSLGAADYVIKPFNVLKLIGTIEYHLNPDKGKESIDNESSANKPGVLIVDDVSSMLRAIQYALHDRYNVSALSKSEDAIDFLRNKTPDLIILDYLMPVLNGFDLIPIIREIPNHKDTPIIIITTEGTPEHVSEAILLGASDFIVKPFKPSEVNSKVAKHIRIARELKKIKEEFKNIYE
jgi:PleD family two-component response regulator